MTGRNPFNPPQIDREKEKAITLLREQCEKLFEFIETLATSRDLSLGKQKLEECELWVVKSISYYGIKK